jgi:hypothetical protein
VNVARRARGRSIWAESHRRENASDPNLATLLVDYS